MRALLVLAAVSSLVCSAAALDPGNQAPIKPATAYLSPPADPAVLRQGGDTIFDAFPIASVDPVPFHDAGATAGYTNDYDAVCPYSGSTSPDVVYSYVTETGVYNIDVDLCYSSYDTKVYVYNSNLSLIACNDDYYFSAPCYTYTSKVENVPVNPGQTYYIVVDGYGGASGSYDIVVSSFSPCYFACPDDSYPEGEPELYDGYVDTYDGGCNTAPDYPFLDLTHAADDFGNLTLCGTSGWYESPGGADYRDTDWFLILMGPTGTIDVTLGGLYDTYFFELGPQDCASVAVIQSAIGDLCADTPMTITGYGEAQVVWFWAGPTTFNHDGPAQSYDYACWFSGLEPGPVATVPTSWSTVKAMFE